MRIGRTSGIGSGLGVERRALGRRVEPVADAPRPGIDRGRVPLEESGRALVPLEPVAAAESAAERLVRFHAHAPLIAQLIASREDLPETRRLRRAEPRHAARLYGAAMEGAGLLVPGYFVDTAR